MLNGSKLVVDYHELVHGERDPEITIIGYSWGGQTSANLAMQLKKMRVPGQIHDPVRPCLPKLGITTFTDKILQTQDCHSSNQDVNGVPSRVQKLVGTSRS